MDRIRVLIVDDSAFMRHALGRLLGGSPGIEIVGSAGNGEEGLAMARALRPDVITLDVEMPVLDGLAMLERLMVETPTRVVMLSSQTTAGAKTTLDALEFGAIDFVSKPSGLYSIDVGRVGDELVAKITAATGMPKVAFDRHCRTALKNLALTEKAAPEGGGRAGAAKGTPSSAAGVGDAAPRRGDRPASASKGAASKLVVVASSTGGPSALHAIARDLPPRLGAAVAVVQHMPPGFTASLAARLDSAGPLPCREAGLDDVLVEDEILVAPGDSHLISSQSGRVALVRLPPVNGVRPAADVTLQSVAPIWGERLLCVVLTGMGFDGREGARAVKRHGGTVYSQDQATSTIYGMPAAIAEAGLADGVYPLQEMATAVARWCAADAGDRDDPDADRPEAGEIGETCQSDTESLAS